ncbi:Thiamine-triphosphatase [Seminavis robusta]|uniref:Thiamine-triphosphatase n=1 Tax=Seminavis robusta TaxID=568900 RepID=A0A9N8F3D3_9STRA|nr:Thiamine-triphosphatase [Seminavis robusta]|eukprot:Sro3376_g347400.1 Thiamine-triphosphatase (336) ;mRNA; r:3628-4635
MPACSGSGLEKSPRNSLLAIFAVIFVLTSPGMALVSTRVNRVLLHRWSVPSLILAMSSTPSSALTEFEVEQKFALRSLDETTQIEKRLQDLGFLPQLENKGPKEGMVDWYWDVASTAKQCKWALSTQDCWLRHRRQGDKAAWQLKLRRSDDYKTAAATVYEEIAGPEAIAKTMILLSTVANSDDVVNSQISPQQGDLLDMFQREFQQDLPTEMVDPTTNEPLLLPFARIETKRSSWIPSGAPDSQYYATVKVDLDMATYGDCDLVYAVGEVEEVVHSADEIAAARERVQAFIEKLTGVATKQPEASPTVMGKLEYYLSHHRPDHYQALVESGILK